jgi:hypothetical protein
MKHFLWVIFILLSATCTAQKYVLVDKQMNLPVIYANNVTVQNTYKGYFPVEKDKLNNFISEVEKISKLLSDTDKPKPETIDFSVGSTSFHGLRIASNTEERIDLILTTDYGASKATFHLSDAKISNARNAYFIKTWLKYLHRYTDKS